MGNRAVITTKEKKMGIYLHWNGGRDSVEAFLKYCELQGYRAPSEDCYGWAYLCQVIGNYFGDGLSLGIDLYERLDRDNWDNGVYIIDGWEIVDREFMHGKEQTAYNLEAMLLDIDSCMPAAHQLGYDFIMAERVDSTELEVGDIVLIKSYRGEVEEYEVAGSGSDMMVNGTNVSHIPFICKYGSSPDEARYNINNYLSGEVRKKSSKAVAA